MDRNRGVDRRGGLGRALPCFALLLGGVLSGLGCGRKIGDSCMTGADCDPTGGTRSCDLSQPGGYCLVEGCDARSCPSDSVCVRFFPAPFVDTAAGTCTTVVSTPACPAVPAPTAAAPACAADEICLTDSADADHQCTGACVRLSLEKRDCVQTCNGNGDCRGGYVCVPTGTAGAIALTLDTTAPAHYCAPAR